jgi:hypothetical protein
MLKQVPNVTRIRFLGTKIVDAAREQLKKACPNAFIERATVHNRTQAQEMAARYQERRDEFEKRFQTYRPVQDSVKIVHSPSHVYDLTITEYTAGPSTWNFSHGVVNKVGMDTPIADIKRNYGAFWHTWVPHPSGDEYLLCGEDYQGYTVVNLTQERLQTYFPESGYHGGGFCWAQVFPSPDGLMLAVAGCYWGGTYQVVFYDFKNPEVLPLPELLRIDDLADSLGWKDNKTFVMTQEIDVRKSDGVPYNSLTEEEQDTLDSDDNLIDYRTEKLEVKRPEA